MDTMDIHCLIQDYLEQVAGIRDPMLLLHNFNAVRSDPKIIPESSKRTDPDDSTYVTFNIAVRVSPEPAYVEETTEVGVMDDLFENPLGQIDNIVAETLGYPGPQMRDSNTGEIYDQEEAGVYDAGE